MAEQQALYEEIGYETALVRLDPENFPEECEACVISCTQIAVYVRRPVPAATPPVTSTL